MGIWCLEAKRFSEETRSSSATSARFYFSGPGSYTIGRQGCDVIIEEDRSISRVHATLEIANDGPVRVQNHGQFGTQAAASKVFDKGVGTSEMLVHDNYYLQFGMRSPFRIYQHPCCIFVSPGQKNEPGFKRLGELSAATGITMTDSPTAEGVRVVMLCSSRALDSSILLALLCGKPVITADWVAQLASRRVWKDKLPGEDAFAAEVYYSTTDGSLKLLQSPGVCKEIARSQFLKGKTFVWLPDTRDLWLQEAVELLGARNIERALRSSRAVCKASEESILVKKSASGVSTPAPVGHLKWTTPELLICGIVNGKLDNHCVFDPQCVSPSPSTKRKRMLAALSAPASGFVLEATAEPAHKTVCSGHESDVTTADHGVDDDDGELTVDIAVNSVGESGSPSAEQLREQHHKPPRNKSMQEEGEFIETSYLGADAQNEVHVEDSVIIAPLVLASRYQAQTMNKNRSGKGAAAASGVNFKAFKKSKGHQHVEQQNHIPFSKHYYKEELSAAEAREELARNARRKAEDEDAEKLFNTKIKAKKADGDVLLPSKVPNGKMLEIHR